MPAARGLGPGLGSPPLASCAPAAQALSCRGTESYLVQLAAFRRAHEWARARRRLAHLAQTAAAAAHASQRSGGRPPSRYLFNFDHSVQEAAQLTLVIAFLVIPAIRRLLWSLCLVRTRSHCFAIWACNSSRFSQPVKPPRLCIYVARASRSHPRAGEDRAANSDSGMGPGAQAKGPAPVQMGVRGFVCHHFVLPGLTPSGFRRPRRTAAWKFVGHSTLLVRAAPGWLRASRCARRGLPTHVPPSHPAPPSFSVDCR